jgi:hypothetical protein
MSLNLDKCEIPELAFWRKLLPERILDYSRGGSMKMSEINLGYPNS